MRKINISKIREEEFPVTKKWIFMNHAAISAIPNRALDAMRQLLSDVSENGDKNEEKWIRRCDEVKRLAAKLIGAEASEIAFVKNTTEGILFVANGLDWRPGDNVVTTNVEFPANIYPWLNLAKKGVETKLIKEKDARIPFEAIESAIDSRTRLVSVSFVEFVSGFRNDLNRIGELCDDKGIVFVVDAIQGLGALNLNVKESKIDFLSCDGHKWLMSVEGAGVFYASKSAKEQIEPTEVGWMSVANADDYLNYDLKLRPDAGRFECGSFNTLGIHGLGGSLELILEVGIEAIEERVLLLTDLLCERIGKKGYNVVSSRRPNERSSIVCFTSPKHDSEDIYNLLLDKGIIAALRDGKIRCSPHFYNSEEEIERAVDTLPS